MRLCDGVSSRSEERERNAAVHQHAADRTYWGRNYPYLILISVVLVLIYIYAVLCYICNGLWVVKIAQFLHSANLLLSGTNTLYYIRLTISFNSSLFSRILMVSAGCCITIRKSFVELEFLQTYLLLSHNYSLCT